MAAVLLAVFCLDMGRLGLGLASHLYAAAPHFLPNLMGRCRWVRAQRSLEVRDSFPIPKHSLLCKLHWGCSGEPPGRTYGGGLEVW